MQLHRPLVVKKEMIETHHLQSFNQCPSYPRQYPLPLHYHCPHFPPQHNWSQYFLPQLLVAGQALHRTRKQHYLHSIYQGLSLLPTLCSLWLSDQPGDSAYMLLGGFTVRTTGSLLTLTSRNTSVRLASMLNSLAPFSLNCQLQ